MIAPRKSFLARQFKHLFMAFSFLSTLGSVVMDLMPHPIRNLVFRIRLGKMGKSVVIDYKVYLRYWNNIEIGDDVVINRGCELYTSRTLGKKIVIGSGVKISPNVKFYGAAHDHTKPGFPDNAGDIIVEDGCWICADSTILQGVTIGRHSVVGAGSVVNRDIPEYSLAAGNPARVIRERGAVGDV